MTLDYITTIAFDKKLKERISKNANQLAISNSALIRLACKEYLDRMEGDV